MLAFARSLSGIAIMASCLTRPVAAEPISARDWNWASRLTWGPVPAVVAGDRPGPGRWLDRQLASDDASLPPAVADRVAAMRISRETMAQIVVEQEAQNRAANALTDSDQRKAARSAYQKTMAGLADEARQRSILRDLYAPDQLREQMTWFWVNHFNVQAGKRDIRAMIADYEQMLHDRAFGRFRDLLQATLQHPAMLRYLDNDRNAVGHINENYAREIMELHSMGVGAGYTQQDVQELARILTGVGIDLKPDPPRLKPEWRPLFVRAGLFAFNPARHDFGDKHFLGHVIKGSGFAEVEQALDLIAAAPATAHHVALRLATAFVGDTPPPALVDRMAATFRRTHGDMAQVMRTMIRAPEFAATLGRSFKDPVHYALSAVRLAYGDRVIDDAMPIARWIDRMGEGLYDHPTPDGYGLVASAWSAPGQMATRFDIARQIGGGAASLFQATGMGRDAPIVAALQAMLQDDWIAATLGGPTRASLAQAGSSKAWNMLFLSSPEFMRR